MPVLALDTSAGVAVAVTDDAGAPLATRHVDQQRHHAELLAPLVQEALADAGVDRRDLTRVVAGTGPAPFTGLRVGLVTARTLALAIGVPALGVPGLDAVAARASRVLPVGDGASLDLLVATDARRREVYWSVYRLVGPGELEVVVPPQVGPAGAVAQDARAAGALAVGRGVLLHPELATPQVGPAPVPPVVPVEPSGPAAAVVPLGAVPGAGPGATVLPDLAAAGLLDPDPVELARLSLARPLDAQPTTPLYLRRPDAVPTTGAKRVTGP
ncbi:tRNA (adenosine(37)-N6)-threonylcarbamoyltransferase complex dimerization subunit type 1 TsaB [Cellulomonas massiliensis]|uniref:tRNA (adenosine(37)-N6)-threonylcarbamoyltransferase complex dimerization subunit type 1 TsaB n=1 Tax=Cellulomonas massiliensis TaxID=1465811 RepID=UPI0002D3043A|nr:tRNA (adenosine(37)-N6)-threonylcarbamoyltransferase complex dimerization subunit type 1 TsaB [Cellulomonas massiliensis]